MSTSTPNYAHTLRWANAPHQKNFKPFGALTTHSGQLVTNVSHSFTVNTINKAKKEYSITHMHLFSNQRAIRNCTQTTPWLLKPGTFRNSLGQLITVQDLGKGIIQQTIGSTNWLFEAEQTARYAVSVNLRNNKDYNFSHTYTADAKNLDIPAVLLPDVLNPNAQPDDFRALEPYGATGVVLDIASLFLGAAIAPEVGLGVALLGAGYGIYGEGVASGWWGGGGGGGHGDLIQ